MAVLVACAVGVAIGLLLVWANARSAITIALMKIKDGEIHVTRGSLAPHVLNDLRDIVSRPRVKSATVRIVRAKDHARVQVQGSLTEPQLQRLRNIVGNVHLSRLVGAGRR
jgi:hypothetical protein